MTQPGTLRATPLANNITEGGATGARESTSLLYFLAILLRNRRLILVCGLLGLVTFGGFEVGESNLYVASGAFTARPSRTSSQVPGAAAQIGLTLGVIDAAQSTVFYAELARSNSVLMPVAERIYTVTTANGTKSGPLAMFKGVKANTPGAAAAAVAKGLLDEISLLASGRSGVVTIRVTDKDPQLAAQIATNILLELDSYSSSTRKEQAVEERKFVERLLAESRQKLSAAEDALARFRQQNQQYLTSPVLRIRDDQLTRDVDLLQQEYANLDASYQQARIEEVRDLSAIRVVEYPDVPVVPQRKEAARKTLIGFVTGLLVGVVIAFMRQRAEEKRRSGDESLIAFSDARRSVSADARHLVGSVAKSSAES